METKKILNYRVHIEKELTGKKATYNASCPTLGLADFGASIDEAIEHITKLIEFHIETLGQLGHSVPIERDATSVITSVHVSVPRGVHYLTP